MPLKSNTTGFQFFLLLLDKGQYCFKKSIKLFFVKTFIIAVDNAVIKKQIYNCRGSYIPTILRIKYKWGGEGKPGLESKEVRNQVQIRCSG